ncbi:hypothetical protein TIFTF001_050421 [Ficus carica]|jgi:hypothetical protein
MVRI